MLDSKMVTAWLLTYLLHSTLFLALAWLAARGPLRRRPALEEAAWRFALVAALVTASIQLAAGYTPLAGRWGLAASTSETTTVSAPVGALSPGRTVALRPGRIPVAERIVLRGLAAVPAPAARPAVPAQPFPWTALIAGLWLAGAVALGARWLAAHLYLSRRLRARPDVVGGDMHALLRRLTADAGLGDSVRLSCSSRLPVPVALGLRRREICVPPRALASLSLEQQEGMLAHELAHLVRRDPFWLAFSHFLASVLFIQPLNLVARRRLRELSELRSDEWAIGRTGRPLSLARCLAEVAGWSFQPLRSLVAPGMADRPSHLAHRIRRLLSGTQAPEGRVRPLWLAAGMAVLLVTVVAAAPGVAPGTPALAGDPAAPAAPALAGRATASAVPGTPALAGLAGQPSPGAEPKLAGLARMAAPPKKSEPGTPAALAAEDAANIADIGDIDVDPEIADIQLDQLEGALAASLAEADVQLENVYDREHLSEADAKALEAQIRAVNEKLEHSLKPTLAEAEKRLDAVMKEFENNPALKDLEARAKEIEEQSDRISKAEAKKMAVDAEKMAADARKGHLTAEQREAFRKQARELAEQARDRVRLSEKDRAELEELTRKAREEQQRFMKEHAVEIETMRKQIREQAAAMREEIRKQIEANPQLKALHERRLSETDAQRKEREKHRDEMRQQRDEARKKRAEERDRRRKEQEKKETGEGHSGGAVSGGVRGGIPGGIRGGVPGGIPGGVAGGVEGGVAGSATH